MTSHKARVAEGWEFAAAEDAALALEALLAKHGVKIEPGCPFEAHVLNALHLVDLKRRGAASPLEQDLRPLYRALIGVYELATLLLAVAQSAQFRTLLPHLRLLNKGSALQNVPSSGRDQATNKLFELYMGAVAIQCGEDVVLEDPDNSDGSNPDVLFTSGGRRWGLACKVLHGRHSEGFVTHLTKGLEQIDASPADVGTVVFNLKNIIPHDDIWPLAPLDGLAGNPLTTAAWSSFEAPLQLLIDSMEKLGAELAGYLPEGHLSKLFAGRKSVPGFLLWGASPSGVVIRGRPTPSSVRAMVFAPIADISPEDLGVLQCLSWAIYADSRARGPRPQ